MHPGHTLLCLLDSSCAETGFFVWNPVLVMKANPAPLTFVLVCSSRIYSPKPQGRQPVLFLFCLTFMDQTSRLASLPALIPACRGELSLSNCGPCTTAWFKNEGLTRLVLMKTMYSWRTGRRKEKKTQKAAVICTREQRVSKQKREFWKQRGNDVCGLNGRNT